MSRLFIALLIFVGTAQANANPWSKYIDCGNGSVVMDQHVASYRATGLYQLVIRHPEAVERVLEANAIPRKRLNEKGELIVTIQLAPQYLPTFIYDGEDSYQDRGAGVVYIVRPKGANLEFEIFSRGPDGRGRESLGLWTFNSCRFRENGRS